MTTDVFCPRCEEWANPDTHPCFGPPKEKQSKGIPRIMLIEFSDVQRIDSSEIDLGHLPKGLSSCEMVGFILKETNDAYFLAKQSWKIGKCRWIHAIPKKSVLKKTTLQYKPEEGN